jgi:hypothetical protein
MTPADALKSLLGGPLRFGDRDQIAKIELVRMAEELIGLASPCPGCSGKGEIDNGPPGSCDKCGAKCMDCGGTEECGRCKGTGVRKWSRDAVYRLTDTEIGKFLQETVAA